MRYDLEAIDRNFPAILSAIGWKPSRSNEKRMSGACPIHNGKDANFHLDLQPDGKWLAICRSQCGGTGWNATRFLADYLHLSHADAIIKAAELAGIRPEDEAPGKTSLSKPSPPISPQKDTARLEMISAAIASKRDAFLSSYTSSAWDADFWHSSEIILPPCHREQAQLFARHLFAPEDILWMGDEYDSGKPRHAAHFRTRDEWLEEIELPPRIAAGTFLPGSVSRSAGSLATTPFIVIESDDLIGRKPTTDAERVENRKQCAALIRFMQDRFKLNLRAVIDTAGKSLHGYFDRPSPAAIEALEEIAEALAIDSQVITRAHNPLRLPGCIHSITGQPAHLCYLNPKHF